MLLSNLLTPQRIRVPMAATDKSGALRELVELVANGSGASPEELLRAVLDREALLSTGIGHGIALPHGKSPLVNELRVSAGVAANPIPYESLDGGPARLFFLLVGPESEAGPHVKALGRISRLVRNDELRERLLAAPDAEEFYRLLRDAERE